MLSVTGLIYIQSDIVENNSKNGAKYFTFIGIGKDPYPNNNKPKEKRVKYYKCQVYVPGDKLEAARKTIVREKTIWIRLGELDGWRLETAEGMNGVYNTVNAQWRWIEPLTRTLSKDKQ